MTLKEIVEIADAISPFETQEEWDNSGLVLGDLNSDVGGVYVALDADNFSIEDIPNNSCLIVHHPPIFKGLKEISASTYPSNMLLKAIKKDISIIAMHTNYDKSHLNRYVAERVLGYGVDRCDSFICYFEVDMDFDEFAKDVADKLGLEAVKTVKQTQKVKRAAITTGSGGDLIGLVEADCFLTGDIKYHQAKDAFESGKSLIDIGHFESERFFVDSIQKELQNKGINAIIAHSINPFCYIYKDK